MRRILLSLLCFFTLGSASLAMHEADVYPSSESTFEDWLDEDPQRVEEFGALRAFLEDEQVKGIVPDWQLTRVDG